ncbi:MAG: 3-dehydroquinate synthase [Selenomonadaceae bacterium]|nr:3-dehydroquinate synthase [Selenomonadaceae bacterium]
MQTVKVNLGENSYEIFIGEKIFGGVEKFISQSDFTKKILVVTDTKVLKNCAEDFTKNLSGDFEIFTIEAGETSKNLHEAEKIYTKAIELGLDRKSLIIALGGGVVGDLAGFVAATYLRGVNFIQVPTTLLAQVDSSVGGKTAVNHALGKNLIGAFYQPKAVFIDLETLKTLPEREIKSGLGEVVKYGIISDEKFFSYLENNVEKILNRDAEIFSEIIKRSCEIKADVVSRDEKESNLRRILNFGHTIAHVIEEETNYKKFRHGEAVAVGMLGAAYISEELGKISSAEVKRLKNLLERLNLETSCGNLDVDKMYKAAFRDKKTLGGKINWVLMKNFGGVEISSDVPENVVKNSLKKILG